MIFLMFWLANGAKMGFDIKKVMLGLQNSDTNMYFCNPIKKPFKVFVGAHSLSARLPRNKQAQLPASRQD